MERGVFDDSWKRLERAAKHAKAFVSGWSGLLRQESDAVGIEDRGNGRHVAIARLIEHVENDLALELGDFFYQLRAALDGLVYRFAVDACAPEAPRQENRIKFPICSTEEHFNKNPLIRGADPQSLKDELERLQPFREREGLAGQEIVTELEQMTDVVRQLIEAFERARFAPEV